MKNIFPVIALSFLAFSCSKEQKADKIAESKTATTVNNGSTNAGTDAATVALNPEHGKPGHRCDIAVGAPLNSAPAEKVSATNQSAFSGFDTNPIKNSAPVQSSSPVSGQAVKIAPQSQPVKADPAAYAVKPQQKTAPGMNPPHGEPNHRCDIAVGAPLSSPKAQTPVAAPQPVPTAVPDQNALASGEKPATNPAHGAPYHRCDLQVGAPLP
ncbi:hypothetical protein [Chryseobacterium sp.]|uniref:hypothetical protein n=1 Tax=Chryseobacterium sp. TaxID=1871047 RepID=UPI0011CA28DD|nr:hypothetical protein [Chryseobacterium sp.]TXF76124.1 hypothetical protein FUA25_09545 [Chryseobacterium sp.]